MTFFDFEVFKNNWLVVFLTSKTGEYKIIVDSKAELQTFYESNKNDIFIGYNCKGYDTYIMKGILLGMDPYKISKHIVSDKKYGWEYSNAFNKIQLNTFDIKTTMHSLKELEGFMGNSICETQVDFDLDRYLTKEELEQTITYCKADVTNTAEIFVNRKEEFESHIGLLNTFKLPIKYITKSKAQLSAHILGATKKERNDEFDLKFPDTLKIEKYNNVVDWYKNKENHDYEKYLEVDLSGVKHMFAWGGLHGGLEQYKTEGILINMDIASMYPAIMLEYGFLSRNVPDSTKYREIRDTRLKYKAEKDSRQGPMKIVLNSTFGAAGDKYNKLYDPCQKNNVCVAGQLLLLDLIEKLEGHCEIIQSNTDGIICKVQTAKDINVLTKICKEWEIRTRLDLEFEIFEKIFQKDVNNYIIVKPDGTYKSKGSYVKKLHKLDNDLPIVNKVLIDYFLHGIPPERTINDCNELISFQKINKVSYKYLYAMYGDERLPERCLRTFASLDTKDKGVYKVKIEDGKERIEKISNTPECCFIDNSDVKGRKVISKLNKQWYIDLAYSRIKDFEGGG